MKVKCIKDFTKETKIVSLNFQKDKAYTLNKVGNSMAVQIGCFCINYLDVREYFEEVN